MVACNVSSVLKAWINCLGSDSNIHSPEVRPGIHTYCYGIPLLSSLFSMIHLTLSNPCSLPSQSYRQKSGVGGAGLPYALWITATLVRDKLREGTLALLTKSASLGNRHSLLSGRPILCFSSTPGLFWAGRAISARATGTCQPWPDALARPWSSTHFPESNIHTLPHLARLL